MPHKFHVLLIDDESTRIQEVKARLDDEGHPLLEFQSIDIREILAHYRNAPAAKAREVVETAIRDRLSSQLFHRIYIDFRLDHGRRFFGTTFLKLVREMRPTATRVLVSNAHYENDVPTIGEFMGAFTSAGRDPPPAHAFVEGISSNIVTDIIQHAETWSSNVISIKGLADDDVDIDGRTHSRAFETVLRHLDRRAGPSTAVKTTIDELWNCLRDLFLPTVRDREVDASPNGQVAEDALSELHVRAFDTGRSTSTVLECIPFTVRQIANQSHRGNRCVVKVGPVGEAGKELARYERYVKFFRTSQRRVELLGQAYGDTLTAICYSFAGGSNTPADSLEDILEKKDLRALDCLGLSYSPRAREWFKDVSSGQSVWKFFESVHFQHDKPINLLDKLHSDLVNWELPELAALLPGPRTLPVQADIGAQYCIVHGDMNAGNIMMANFPSNPIDFEATRAREEWWERRVAAIASDSAWAGGQRTAGAVASSPASDGLLGAKAILIDYRHTRRGPVFIDFAALECSIRGMPECVYNRGDLHAIANDYDREISLWKLAWEKDPFESCGRDQWRGLGYWGAASYELIQLARRNFEGTQDFAGEHALRKKLTRDAWKKEYAATCMLYALRLLKYEDFGDIRVREASGRTDKSLRNETRVRIAVWIAALSQTY